MGYLQSELYLPALLGGPEQVSSTSEAAGGDSRRGDSAAPAATELNYMEKYIEKYMKQIERVASRSTRRTILRNT